MFLEDVDLRRVRRERERFGILVRGNCGLDDWLLVSDDEYMHRNWCESERALLAILKCLDVGVFSSSESQILLSGRRRRRRRRPGFPGTICFRWVSFYLFCCVTTLTDRFRAQQQKYLSCWARDYKNNKAQFVQPKCQ